MKSVLKKLFIDPPPTTLFLSVDRRISTSRYQLVDDAGRISFADSTDFYPPGTAVIVRSGAIVEAGSRAGKPKTYEV